MEDAGSITASVGSRTPSINSRMYAIPMDVEDGRNLAESSSDDDEEEEDREEEEECNTDNGDEDSADEISEPDTFLDRLVPQTSNTFLLGQPDTPMFDVSKYIFQSLVQSINSVDFSEAVSLQTKTSGLVNSKSRELKKLMEEVQQKLQHFQEVFHDGAKTSKRIKYNLQQASSKITRINRAFETEFPIEFNQAKERVYDRNLDENP